jgi:hypothetical protein
MRHDIRLSKSATSNTAQNTRRGRKSRPGRLCGPENSRFTTLAAQNRYPETMGIRSKPRASSSVRPHGRTGLSDRQAKSCPARPMYPGLNLADATACRRRVPLYFRLTPVGSAVAKIRRLHTPGDRHFASDVACAVDSYGNSSHPFPAWLNNSPRPRLLRSSAEPMMPTTGCPSPVRLVHPSGRCSPTISLSYESEESS